MRVQAHKLALVDKATTIGLVAIRDRQGGNMPRRLTNQPPRYIAHTQPGLERIAGDEIRSKLPMAYNIRYKRLRRQNGIVVFDYAGELDVLSLRTVEDVFRQVAYIRRVAWGREGLSQIRRILLAAQGLGTIVRDAFPALRRRPLTFRVVARLAGKQPYRRQELRATVEQAIEQKMHRRWIAVPEGGDIELWATLLGMEFLLGLRLSDAQMRHRNYKQVHIAASLRPSVAAAMVWLAKPRAGQIFLDPLCGAGTIVIERALAARYRLLVAGDIDAASLEAAKENIGPKHKPRQLFHWDATALPLKDQCVHQVVTNLPFGVQVGDPAWLEQLYPRAIREIARVLLPGGTAVLLSGRTDLIRKSLAKLSMLNPRQTYPITILGRQATIYVLRKRNR